MPKIIGPRAKIWQCRAENECRVNAPFTCAAIRAIHLEIVEDETASSFLRAFRRFISRRGIPEYIILDNAKTFKAGSQELTTLKSQIINAAEPQKVSCSLPDKVAVHYRTSTMVGWLLLTIDWFSQKKIKKSYLKYFSEFYGITNHTNGGRGYTQQSPTHLSVYRY